MSQQRRYNVAAASWRCNDVVTTLLGRCVFAGANVIGMFISTNLALLWDTYCYDRALLPSIICLGRLRIASKYIFNLWQLRQGVDSFAQWLEHWIFNREDRVRFPRQAWDFFSYASFLCYGFHVVKIYTVRLNEEREQRASARSGQYH